MNVEAYFRSLTAELESLKDRVRNFIRDAHWLTDGEWKKSVLRTILARNLPDTVKIGRGFVLTPEGASTQCDIILYKASSAVLFREGDLVFLTPEDVLGIIEVKSSITKRLFESVVDKFSEIARKLGDDRSHCFFGVFSYDTAITQHATILNVLHAKCSDESQVIDVINIGCSTFVKWWKRHPGAADEEYAKWHSYQLTNMSAGYFIANIVEFVSPESVQTNSWLWYPPTGKEFKKTGEIELRQSAN